MIKVKNLSLAYGDQDILNQISFSLKKGQITGLLGPNGAGKSSIIKVLAGLVYPKSGELLINEKSEPFKNLRKYCGYLIDGPSYYPYLTAHQNLNLLNKINGSQMDPSNLLIKVGLDYTGNKKVKFFSTGMKQRLALAMAMINSPSLLILDEPFNGLDPNGFQELINLLKKLNQDGITILVSSHLLNELEQLADQFILIHNGVISMNLSAKELQQQEKRVTFTFAQTLDQLSNDYLVDKNAVFEGPTKVTLNLKSNEIANVVNRLVDLQSTPINIETKTVLQEKYFEITS